MTVQNLGEAGHPFRVHEALINQQSRRPQHESTESTPIPNRPTRIPWHRSFRRAVLATDAIVLLASVLVAEFIRFGLDPNAPASASATYSVLGAVIAAGWWGMLQLYGAADERMLGHGAEEYRRVAQASVMGFGLLAIATLLLKQDLSRGYLAIAFPIGLTGLLVARKALRLWLVRQRRHGLMCTNVLVVGGHRSAASIERYFGRHPEAGFRLVGVWKPDAQNSEASSLTLPGRSVPVLGGELSIAQALDVTDSAAVFVTDTEHLGPNRLKDLTWELQAQNVELMVSPNVVDVAAPRISLRNIDAMPFLHLEKPQYENAARWGKVLFDRIGAALLICLTSPLLVAAAVAVWTTSRGPVFFKQERIGKDAEPFDMFKFRSMHVDADARLEELLREAGGTMVPLAKLKKDPRVTRVGSILRRYSIDELPQLFNVLSGKMSLVGPRPQRQFEVDLYDHVASRRLTVRPGMTGLWQVSGRSDLSWDDTVRLDTYYVENWSMVSDVTILWKTIRAVLGSSGAY